MQAISTTLPLKMDTRTTFKNPEFHKKQSILFPTIPISTIQTSTNKKARITELRI